MTSRKIMLDGLHLGGARVWTLLLAVATTYSTARLLGPRDFGLLAAFNLVPQIATYGSLGWDSAVTRELPHLRASGRLDEAASSRDTAYTAELTMAILWMIVALVVSLFMDTPAMRAAALLGGAAVLIGKLSRLFAIDAFVQKDFRIQANVAMITASASAVFQSLGAWLGGAVAAFSGIVLANAIGLVVFKMRRPMRFSLSLHRQELWRLTVIGLPLAALGLLSGTTGATVYLERTLIGTQAGLATLGLYVFAGNVNNSFVAFVGDFARSWQPHLLEALARPSEENDRERWLTRPGLALSYTAAFLATCMLAGVPLLIRLLLPAYVAVIPVLPILLFAGLIGCLLYVPGNFLLSSFANQQMFYTKLWLVGIAAFAVTLWSVLKGGFGLPGIAAAAIVPPLVVICGSIPKAYSFYETGWRVQLPHVIHLIAPGIYVSAVHLLCRAGFKDVLTGSVLVHELALAGVTLALTLPPLGLLAWHTFDGSRVWRERHEAS